MVLRPPLENNPTSENDEDDELIAKNKDYRYVPERMTWDPNCYECKVRYRDPKAKDLVMYLHAWRYKVSKLKNKTKYFRLLLSDEVSTERPETDLRLT